MLLTQTQVSAAISSFTIIFFTGLLFLSGYILQQRTVASLQTAIRPRIHALKSLPQAQSPPPSTTVAVEWGDAGAPLKMSASGGVEDNVEGEVYEYLEGVVNDDEQVRLHMDVETDVVEEVEDRKGGAPLDVLVSVGEEGASATWRDDVDVADGVYDDSGDVEDDSRRLRKNRQSSRKGKLRSLEDWAYSDETEGQKRMREGLGVLDRWAQT